MNRTPGYLLVTEFPNTEAAVKKLHEVDGAAGFTPLGETLLHSDPDVDEFLEHHGIKGMHWGVRRDLHPSGSGVSAATVKDTKTSEKAEAVKSIASYETRSLEKLNPSVSDEEASRFTPEQKRALKIAAGVAVTSAVLAFGVYEAKNNPDAIAKISSMAGKKISPEEFKSNVDFSKAYSWRGNAVLKPSIINHSEFTIPAGTTYHRIARDVEHSFNPITYATPSVEDFNRYLTSYGHVGGNPQHISWESNSDIKVPGLPTVLGTFHEAMHENYSKAPRAVKKTLDANAIGKNYLSPENVQRVYSNHTGGHWTDSVAASFISRLKEKGYGAIVDDMDSGVLADTPVVLFSPEKMGAKRSVPNTEEVIAEAKHSLTELKNRKLPAHLQHSSVDEFLAHHGIKGMHWGVRKAESNEEEGRGSKPTGKPEEARKNISKSTNTSSDAKGVSEAFTPAIVKSLGAGVENLTPRDKAVLKSAGMSPTQSEVMKAKYGPDSAKDSEKKGLTPAQKKMIVYGAIGLGAVGLFAYAAHAGNADIVDTLANSGGYEKAAAKELLKTKPEEARGIAGLIKTGVKAPSAKYLMESDIAKAAHSAGLTPKDALKLSREDLNFEPGHVFKRVSTEAEKDIRASGFYASHSDADTERYKAVLPVYWKIWNPTNPPKSGFVNHLAASVPLKVANEGTIYDTMKNSLDDVIDGKQTLRNYLKFDTGFLSGIDDETLVNKAYYSTVAKFLDPEDAAVKHITEKLKAAGYSGIVDANDAGSLSAQPVKFLDGTIFKIVAHEPMSSDDIQSAQESIKALAHIMMKSGVFMSDEVDEFLAHFGVKGMHWGVNHARSDAHEYVKAKLAIGEGAGNRRKLIKAKVETRSKKSPEYKKAFDEHVEKFSQHSDRLARQAVINKNVKATRKSVGKTARGVHRSLTGGFGSVSLASAAIAGAAVYAHNTGLDKKLINVAQETYHKRNNYADVAAWLKSQGVG